mgnify:CR=1 FL=1
MALGTSKRLLFATIMSEAVALAVLSAIIGLALGLSSHYERTLDEDSFKRY